ncbi:MULTISPECIES: DUF5790 family protein [unclassified Haladaptatus]|uniref:DUF5790 family protein n=1 Tax=unclassified Haladaptatus TaxID=2622732 RepID=UPI0023E8875C|nr:MULTISPECIES: DUF5790 family protein [unclassified Haladaptatus]
MSQATLNDDELFGEAASEMRADVESHLQQAYESLPAADDVWDVEAENTLGVLNSLRSALNTGDAEEHLRNAKKWYTMGVRADAFEDADDLEQQIEDLTELIEEIEEAHEKVGGLTSTIPKLRKSLEAMGEEAEDADEEDEEEEEEDEEE